MLPDVNRNPPQLSQPQVLPAIALDVAVQLGRPPVGVVLRRRPVARAAMPEATINKDSDLRFGQRNVRCPRKRSEMDAKSKAKAMKFSPQRNLHPGIPAGHRTHLLAYDFVERCGARNLTLRSACSVH